MKSDNDNYNLIAHELNKLAKKQIAYEKASRGVEDEETITVHFQVSQFMAHLGNSIESNTVDAFFKSNAFKREKGFKIEGNKVSCTKTM